jgi:hypothetical protein
MRVVVLVLRQFISCEAFSGGLINVSLVKVEIALVDQNRARAAVMLMPGIDHASMLQVSQRFLANV